MCLILREKVDKFLPAIESGRIFVFLSQFLLGVLLKRSLCSRGNFNFNYCVIIFLYSIKTKLILDAFENDFFDFYVDDCAGGLLRSI